MTMKTRKGSNLTRHAKSVAIKSTTHDRIKTRNEFKAETKCPRAAYSEHKKIQYLTPNRHSAANAELKS